ncbi:helix-turn-helix transcriptional regulator [Eggerthellaceae bacterium 24-137]
MESGDETGRAAMVQGERKTRKPTGSGAGSGWNAGPQGLGWTIAAVVALVSSAMLLHESASWSLDYATLAGRSVNVRAYSCDVHSLGLVFGYALTQACGPWLARHARDMSVWLVFFLVQFVDVLVFYWLMDGAGPLFAVVVVQFVGAASGAMFFVAASQVAAVLAPRQFLLSTVAVIGGTTLVVQGLFSILETNAPLFVSELLHLGLLGAAAFASMRATRPGSCLVNAYEQMTYLPICCHRPHGEEATTVAEAPQRDLAAGWRQGAGGKDASAAPSAQCAKLLRSMPLCGRLFLIVGAYGGVFGFLHVVPLALPLGVVARVSSFLIGAVVALALFAVTMPPGRARDVSWIWNRFYRFVFPVVTVAALLGPLTASTEFLPALVMQACALYYFDALLATACYAVCCSIHAEPSQVFGRAFLIRSVGFLAGNVIGSAVHDTVMLDTAAFSVIGTVVFVLLCLVTFNMNSERYAKTVWGLLPHEDPRGRYERTREERCDALAKRCGLTEREAEVLRLLARNMRPREISDTLVVSVATVRSHVHAIYTKADVHSAGELMRLIDESGDQV